MIITYRHRLKRGAKPTQAAEIEVPRIVQHTQSGRSQKRCRPTPKPMRG
jgi:hypothetical protein